MRVREITSRERTLAAIDHQELDRVPIFFRRVAPLNHLWKDEYERVDVLLKMGVDEKITIKIEPGIHPDVRIRDWFEEGNDPRYRLACREYETPKGVLRAVMRCTEDCSYEDGVPLASDHNISRGIEFPVKGRDDLPKLAYLLREPDGEDIARFREDARRKKEFAARRGILVEGYGGPGGDLAFWLCGTNLYYLVQDDPDFGEELMEMIYNIDLKCMEIVLDEGVDIIDARGCYETAPMWSPQLYDKLFAPRLEKKAKLAHQAGAKFSYFTEGLLMPHLDSLLRIGVDVVNGIQPGDGNDMSALKQAMGHRICLWGGINPHEVIERGTQDDVRRAVIEVILAAAPGGGFVLSTSGGIYRTDCYDNVVTYIETAHQFGTYPINTSRLKAELRRSSR